MAKTPSIGVINIDLGNIFSVCQAFKYFDAHVKIVKDVSDLKGLDAFVLPGVGAFNVAMERLQEKSFDRELLSRIHSGMPCLGICLGMQLMFEKSYEFGESNGFGVFAGDVRNLKEILPVNYKTPHIGWNSVTHASGASNMHPVFSQFYDFNESCNQSAQLMYFVHSFFIGVENNQPSSLEVEYGGKKFTAGVADENVICVQFHPEKSGNPGLEFYKNFIDFCKS